MSLTAETQKQSSAFNTQYLIQPIQQLQNNNTKLESDACIEVPETQRNLLNALMNIEPKSKEILYKKFGKYLLDPRFIFSNRNSQVPYQELLPDDTECSAEAGFSQRIIVKNYALQLITQPIVTPPDEDFKNISKVQLDSQDHANFYLDSVDPVVGSVHTAAKSFWGLIETYREDMDDIINDLANEKPGAKEIYLDETGLIIDESERVANKLADLVSKLQQTRSIFGQDGSEFKTIQNIADLKYGANQGEMKLLKDELEDLLHIIVQCNAIIAAGAIGILLGALIIALGVLLELPSAGASTALVTAGTGLTVAGSGAVKIARDTREAAKAEYKTKLARYNLLQQTCSLIEALVNELSSLIVSNERAVFAAEAQANDYDSLAENVRILQASADSIQGSVENATLAKRYFKKFVNDATSLKEFYKDLEKKGTITVEVERAVWNTLFPYRSSVPKIPQIPLELAEYLALTTRKRNWVRAKKGRRAA